MRRLAPLCFLVATPLHAQAIPDLTAVEAALQQGTTAKACDVMRKGKSFGESTGFDLQIFGPLNRVECAAAVAARKYQRLTVDDGRVEAGDGHLYVVADPIAPIRFRNGSWHVTAGATHMVLFPGENRDAAAVIQPDSVDVVPSEWGNAAGGQFQSQGLRAWFSALKIPSGAFSIAVVTTGREYRFKVSAKDRQRIR